MLRWLESPNGKDHWEDQSEIGNNIRMVLTIIGWECVDWIHMAQDGASGKLL
jgi:hypothetical protein